MSKNIEELVSELCSINEDLQRDLDLYGETTEPHKQDVYNILVLMHRENVLQPGIIVQYESSPEMLDIINQIDAIWQLLNNGPVIEKMKVYNDNAKFWSMVYDVANRLGKLRPIIVTSDTTAYGFATFYAEAVKCWSFGLYRASVILCCSILEEVITGEISKEEKDFALSLNYSDGTPHGVSARTFQEIIQAAYDRGYLNADQFKKAESIRLTRNNILHEMKDVSEDESLSLISATREIIQSLLSNIQDQPIKPNIQSNYQKAFTVFLGNFKSLFEEMQDNLGKIFKLDTNQQEQFDKFFRMSVWNPGEIVQVLPEDEIFANGILLHVLYEFEFDLDSFDHHIIEGDSENFWSFILVVLGRIMQIRPAFVTIDPSRYDFEEFYKEAIRAWSLGLNRSAFALCASITEDVLTGELIRQRITEPLQLIYERDQVAGVGRSKMRNLLGKAMDHKIINRVQAKSIRKLLSKRNGILHGMQEVGSKETLKAIETTREIIESILLDE
jgi:hypothetical protein